MLQTMTMHAAPGAAEGAEMIVTMPMVITLAQAGGDAGGAPAGAAAAPAGNAGAPAAVVGGRDGAGGTEGTGVAPADPAAAAPAPNPLGGIMPFFLVGMVGLMVFTMFKQSSAQKKEKARLDEMRSGLKRNDKVQTIGGIVGTISDMSDDEVTIETDRASGSKVRVVRSAVQLVVRPSNSPEPAAQAASV